MRSRSVRLTFVIILILGLAIAALGFRAINIDIPGLPELNREGAGPFGLKLGLDLSGGGHLAYQADTGSRFDVTLLEPANREVIARSLANFRFGDEQLALEEYQVFLKDVDYVQREIPAEMTVPDEGDERAAEDEEAPQQGEDEEPPEPQFVIVEVAGRFQIRARCWPQTIRDALACGMLSRTRWARWICSR